MSRRMDVVLDNALNRLLWAAKGVQKTEHLPKASGQTLVALAMAVSYFVDATEYPLAKVALGDIDRLVASGGDEVDKEVCETMQRRTAAVRKALKWTE